MKCSISAIRDKYVFSNPSSCCTLIGIVESVILLAAMLCMLRVCRRGMNGQDIVLRTALLYCNAQFLHMFSQRNTQHGTDTVQVVGSGSAVS